MLHVNTHILSEIKSSFRVPSYFARNRDSEVRLQHWKPINFTAPNAKCYANRKPRPPFSRETYIKCALQEKCGKTEGEQGKCCARKALRVRETNIRRKISNENHTVHSLIFILLEFYRSTTNSIYIEIAVNLSRRIAFLVLLCRSLSLYDEQRAYCVAG